MTLGETNKIMVAAIGGGGGAMAHGVWRMRAVGLDDQSNE